MPIHEFCSVGKMKTIMKIMNLFMKGRLQTADCHCQLEKLCIQTCIWCFVKKKNAFAAQHLVSFEWQFIRFNNSYYSLQNLILRFDFGNCLRLHSSFEICHRLFGFLFYLFFLCVYCWWDSPTLPFMISGWWGRSGPVV